jgi:hypothetical protein
LINTFAYSSLDDPSARATCREVTAYLLGRLRLQRLEDPEIKKVWDNTFRKRAAAHETGHVIAGLAVGYCGGVKRIAISKKSQQGYVEWNETGRVEFTDLPNTVRALLVNVGGIMGERVLFSASDTAGYDELAYLICVSQGIEAFHGIPGLVAFRATLAECERIIKSSRLGAEALMSKLMRDGEAGPENVKQAFPTPIKSTFNDWLLAVKNDSGTRFPDLERHAVIGAGLAASAHQHYSAPNGRVFP